MDYWPADERNVATKDETLLENNGKKIIERDSSGLWRYPHLEYGTIGGATLVARKGRMKWKTVTDTSGGMALASICNPVRIFPETRPPVQRLANDHLVKRTKLGPQFLRTYVPDADFPAELVNEELEADMKLAADLAVFDPYSGNVLETISSHQKPNTSFVFFPMGECGNDLNISLLVHDGENPPIFEASGHPSYVFETPIQHIVTPTTSLMNTTSSMTPNSLLIRTLTATSMMVVDLEMDKLQVSRKVDIVRSDVGDRPVVDGKITAVGSSITLVNDIGHIYRCSVYEGSKSLQVVPASKISVADLSRDTFWKLALTENDQGCYLASQKFIGHTDLRTGDPFSVINSLDNLSDSYTYIECGAQDQMIRVATTSKLVWFDHRFCHRPLLSVRHGRQYDRTLETRTMHLSQTPLTILTSRKNGFITAYDVNHDADGLLRYNSLLTQPPYYGSMYDTISGHSMCAHPSGTEASLFQLSQQGSIYRRDLRFDGAEKPSREPYSTHNWPSVVKDLDRRSANMVVDLGCLEDRELSEVTMHAAFQRIFSLESDENRINDADKYYDMLDKMPQVLQSDVPVESMMTSFDIAFRAGDEPVLASRADFLTGGAINSSRGHRALMRGDLPIRPLIEQVAWHHNLSPCLKQFCPEMSDNWQAVYGDLSQLDLELDPRRPASSMRREAQSREQLVLDLALASDILSPQPCRVPSNRQTETGLEAISAGTEGLSLNNEPPEIQFGYMRPVPKAAINHYAAKGEDGGGTPLEEYRMSSSLGVRLLLAEWQVGTDVDHYEYQDPYDESYKPRTPTTLCKRNSTVPIASQSTVVPTQRPPVVIAAAVPPPSAPIRNTDRSFLQTFSQGMDYRSNTQTTLEATSIPSSQDIMASTQVLPGVHGGRTFLLTPPLLCKGHRRSRRAPARHWTLCSVKRKALHGWNKASKQSHSCLLTPYSSLSSKPSNPWFDQAAVNDFLRRNKSVVCALSASYISTFAGYPLDSLKSRLQTTKSRISVVRLAGLVYREEGVRGFYRGLWIPLVTISFVRAASFTIYSGTKEYCRNHQYFSRDRMADAAMTGGISGALSGSLISFASAPFELVKVRRQLEFTIAASKGINLVKPPNTLEAVGEIFRRNGLSGLYIGFPLHFFRDTAGTALYFFEYDAMRHLLGRRRSGEQGPTPHWLPIPVSLIPFVCGSLAGVTSWALIYPVDVVKTKVQQRALSGIPPRGVWDTLHRLVRGPDPKDPKPMLAGIARIYRGLGVSAVRSIITHGLLWTFFDITSHYIDHLH
ncbi:hypothetical protein BJ138DRAFT_1083982 [Hygrophoropsis aurantiaca]|uniref:Uncharacterized protein n=1 Tax=Hygrophoropsis aurantiaca TaxID=72124 RepID=A0ACB8AFJ4_9AGAM|nr:hypothetical protein BJ138DRAFT_1083982 [Hygrophoropsis aurantiaca]